MTRRKCARRWCKLPSYDFSVVQKKLVVPYIYYTHYKPRFPMSYTAAASIVAFLSPPLLLLVLFFFLSPNVTFKVVAYSQWEMLRRQSVREGTSFAAAAAVCRKEKYELPKSNSSDADWTCTETQAAWIAVFLGYISNQLGFVLGKKNTLWLARQRDLCASKLDWGTHSTRCHMTTFLTMSSPFQMLRYWLKMSFFPFFVHFIRELSITESEFHQTTCFIIPFFCGFEMCLLSHKKRKRERSWKERIEFTQLGNLLFSFLLSTPQRQQHEIPVQTTMRKTVTSDCEADIRIAGCLNERLHVRPQRCVCTPFTSENCTFLLRKQSMVVLYSISGKGGESKDI